MKPEWRTAPVRALCQQMLNSRTFEALPIVADALQDAGCTDDDLLAQCRDPNVKRILAERLVNLVYSAETAAAVVWLDQFVRDINYRDYKDADDKVGTKSNVNPHTYEYIIEVGHRGAAKGSMSFRSDAGADFFRKSDDNRREFFRNWSLVTGVSVPTEVREHITFICSC